MNERLSLSGAHTLAGCSISQEKKTIRFSREYNAVKDEIAQLGEIWDNRWNVVGAKAAGLTVKALGEAIVEIPDWRDIGLPRASLMSSPAVFDGETLVSAPIAGFHNGFEAKLVTDFSSFLVSR